MSEIRLLSPHVADLIAAGEVVERPASVIKELVENAFDAGAHHITIEFKSGGMTYIRVSDDGCGMTPEDAGLCFMRHATSKLLDERGLESIRTMGFRGEALAAIAAVSRVELLTRKNGTDYGTRVLLEAGDIIEMSPHGCPEGTTIIVRDLFFNTPARLKFMKADKAEGSACVSVSLRCALGRPEISVRLIKDGQEEYFSPGDGKLSSCVYSLLGRDVARDLLECAAKDEEIAISGFIGSPKAGHGNRTKQFFFCNGRNIKSQLLQSAVEQAYRNTLLSGRYPACVIYLTLSFGAVDVNVHPAKTEIKFRDAKKVFDAIYYAALSTLESESATTESHLPLSTTAVATPNKDFSEAISAPDFRDTFSEKPRQVAPAAGNPAEHAAKPSSPQSQGTLIWRRRETPSFGKTAVHDNRTLYRSSAPYETLSPAVPSPADNPQITIPSSLEPDFLHDANRGFRLIGEAMKTYIIVEMDNELILIDKHAAHERMIFDKLKGQEHAIMSQTLLVPVTLRLNADELELLVQNATLLERLGFEIEPYGVDSVILRSVPADSAASDAAPMVEEILDNLRKNISLSHADALDEILHTVACKAAVKAGWNTQTDELNQIVGEVVSGRVKYCPHGRPVSMTLTKKQLDKAFSRIV